MTDPVNHEWNLYAEFETDTSLEETGTWCEILPGVEIKVKRFTSKAVSAERERLNKPYEKLLRRGKELPEDVTIELVLRQIANAAVVEWKGVKDRDGRLMDCTPDNVYKLVKDIPHVATTLINFAAELDNYKAEAREEEVKNSETSSPTT